MHADTPRPAPFSRIRLVHVAAPIIVSVGLVIAGYVTLPALADDIASTVKPIETEATTASIEPAATSTTTTSIAAN